MGFLVSENIQIDILYLLLCCLARKLCTKDFQLWWWPSWIFFQFKRVRCSGKKLAPIIVSILMLFWRRIGL